MTMMVDELPEIDLFDDEEASYEDIELNDNLLPWEIEEAARLVPFLRGVMLSLGMPGQGKDLFSSTICYKIKKYFKGKRPIRDERPRSLFGPYTFFDENVLLADMAKLDSIASGAIPKEINRANKAALAKIQQQATRWQTAKGEVMLQYSIAHFAEFWRYMHNRRPMNPMGIALGGIIKIWRHLDCMVIGVAQQSHELDRFSCLPYVTMEARCSWATTRRDTVMADVTKVRYVSTRGVFEMGSRKPTRIWVDGGRQRPELGIEVVTGVKLPKLSGIESSVVELLHDNGRTPLWDLSAMLEESPFRVREVVQRLTEKNILISKRFFDLYNSKSAVAIKPRANFKM